MLVDLGDAHNDIEGTGLSFMGVAMTCAHEIQGVFIGGIH